MKCPSCKTPELKGTRIEGNLPAFGCKQCEGALISLLYYRDWAERTVDNTENEAQKLDAQVVDTKDSVGALNCPKCSRIMTKFRITGCNTNRLDLCNSCDEAWLDTGEWELLKALQLSKSLPKVFSQSWQTKVRKEQGEANFRARYAKIVGEEDLNKAQEVRQWLNGNKHRTDLLFYINKEID